jgi:hypothetical protein
VIEDQMLDHLDARKLVLVLGLFAPPGGRIAQFFELDVVG